MSTKAVLYSGPPIKILGQAAEEIMDILSKGGMSFDGLHVLALLHLASGMIIVGSKQGRLMPSYASILSLITHNMSKSVWSKEEAVAFEKEFRAIVESLGGRQLSEEEKNQPVVMSPTLGVQ